MNFPQEMSLPTQKRENKEKDRFGYYFKEQEHSYNGVGLARVFLHYPAEQSKV